MQATRKKMNKVFEMLEEKGVEFTIAQKYGERGYSTEKGIILLADWNELSKEEIDLVEKVAEIEWSDEWIVDDDGRAFRTTHDSYFWQPQFSFVQGEIVGHDYLKNNPSELLDLLESDYCNNAKKAFSSDIIKAEDFEKMGCKLLSANNENGLHVHMTDTPEGVLAEAKTSGKWFFRIGETSQFYCTFELWQMPIETEETED